MFRVLLKRVKKNSKKNYQKDVAKISKTAISVQSEHMPCLKMYSKGETEHMEKGYIRTIDD